ncbi:MAG TPA: hypothetical protein VFU47_05705 [Armatimonadota bacterium]|nr:hypothetical protein [Armatimonadota bacterium]
MTPEELLSWVIPSREECRAAAERLRIEYPELTAPQVAWKAVKSARRWAAATGAATGVVANPVAMFPAAAAEIGAMFRIEGKMAGITAALLDPDALENEETFKTDVMALVFPMAAVQALQQLGVRGGQLGTRALIRGFMSKGLLAEIIRLALKYLGVRLTRRALISKTVPVVGAGIGATWNWLEVETLGRRAIRYYRTRETERERG